MGLVAKADPIPFTELDAIPGVKEKGKVTYPPTFKDSVYLPRPGYAKIWTRVNQEGVVTRMQVIECSHPFFADHSMEAILATIFEPPLQEGKPVETEFLIGFTFRDARMEKSTNYDILVGESLENVSVNQNGRALPLMVFDTKSAGPVPGGRADQEYELLDAMPANNYFDWPASVSEGPLHYDQVPQLIKFYIPCFPASRVLAGKGSEDVIVSWLVAPNGVVFQPFVPEGTDEEFGHAAKAAVRYWNFLPGSLNEVPVMAALATNYEFSRFYRLDTEIKAQAKKIKKGKIQPVDSSDLDEPLNLIIYEPVRYPLIKDNQHGYAIIQGYIDPKGKILLPDILETNNKDIAWSAITAVSRWRFSPPTVNGEPVYVLFRKRFEN
jgi:hypothetical protein